MLRKYLIQQYITLGSKISIFDHHGSIHIKLLRKTLFALLLLWLGSTVASYLRGSLELIQWILSGMCLLIYFYFILEFLNNYLDALISSDRGLTIFRWDGILQYNVQQFERSSIEMISFTQDSFGDKLRNKGDVVIHLDHGVSFRIEQIRNPNKVVNILWSVKGEHQSSLQQTAGGHEREYSHEDSDKFNILVETLGEVIKDYIDRRPSSPRLQ